MHKKIFTVLFLVFFSFIACAQQSDIPQTDGIKDSTFTINNNDDNEEIENASGFAKDVKGDTLINFNGFEISIDSINKWKKSKEYKWINNLDSFLIDKKRQSEKEPTITLKQNKGVSFLDKVFGSRIFQTLLWVMAISLLLFIIYKLFLQNAFLAKRSKKAVVEIEADEEDVTLANDYDSLLQKAYLAGELRLATHYLFLKTLQKLNNKEMIKYAVDKTNSIYVKELAPGYRNLFATLALYYEYVWYGNATITKETFDLIKIKFNDFLNRI